MVDDPNNLLRLKMLLSTSGSNTEKVHCCWFFVNCVKNMKTGKIVLVTFYPLFLWQIAQQQHSPVGTSDAVLVARCVWGETGICADENNYRHHVNARACEQSLPPPSAAAAAAASWDSIKALSHRSGSRRRFNFSGEWKDHAARAHRPGLCCAYI